ncbi:MerR family transcriptional regulator [Actinokineospora auranticolor]|uniref:DNA-binding transcriptional MerR regulator n=1 Tax=Actinokineospora auranticolor TaxID=155976 RepID=A0A2S6GI00_9PSEU|nr:MerR family transcriptional regulator [Actinokineospora auranticolor]PPK64854.1 DNA-binding transcriptional MerR regulator [Actinokineospora auranticolor]
MRISELAERTGTTPRALRFYESRGLIDAPRAVNGYRDYGEAELRQVSEIVALQAAGLSLDETRPFVECLRSGHDRGDACADSVEVYRRKLAEVDECLARLDEVRADLLAKLARALARQPGTCGVDGAADTVTERTPRSGSDG